MVGLHIYNRLNWIWCLVKRFFNFDTYILKPLTLYVDSVESATLGGPFYLHNELPSRIIDRKVCVSAAWLSQKG